MHTPQSHAQDYGSAMVEAMAARNLQFLALIENTIDRLASDTDHVRACAKGVAEAMDSLKAICGDAEIEAESRLVELLEKTQETARRIHADAKRRHEAACNDKQLQEDDGVVDAYSDFINAVEGLFDCAADFKDWIETHNALLAPRSGNSYSSVASLTAALNAD